MTTTIVSAALAWIAVLYTAPRYVRARGDVRVGAYWYTVLLLALALTLGVPLVYVAFDGFVRLPNAARWLDNALVLVAAYTIDGFFYALARGAATGDAGHGRRRRLRLVPLVVAIIAMAILLGRAGQTRDIPDFSLLTLNGALIAYRVVFLSFFTFVALRFVGHATHYRRLTPDLSIKLGMSLSLIGGWCAVFYSVFSVVELLAPRSALAARILNPLLMVAILLAVAFVTIGSTLPLWGRRVGVWALVRHLATARAARRLGPLWRALSAAVPDVVLPTSLAWWPALLHPAQMELLLNRRVVEILDARRALLAATTSAGRATWDEAPPASGGREVGTGNAGAGTRTAKSEAREDEGRGRGERSGGSRRTTGAGARAGPPDVDAQARLDALRLAIALGYVGDTGRAPRGRGAASRAEAHEMPLGGRDGDAPLYGPPTFGEQVRYLERVAAELRLLRRRGWAIRRGSPPRPFQR